MSKEHTPTPWRIEDNTTLIWGACNPDDLSSYGMGYPVAECRITPISQSSWCNAPYSDEGEANAAHIVKCVNMHDELVEALKEINNLNENHSPFGGEMYRDRIDMAWELVRETLKKAGAL